MLTEEKILEDSILCKQKDVDFYQHCLVIIKLYDEIQLKTERDVLLKTISSFLKRREFAKHLSSKERGLIYKHELASLRKRFRRINYILEYGKEKKSRATKLIRTRLCSSTGTVKRIKR